MQAYTGIKFSNWLKKVLRKKASMQAIVWNVNWPKVETTRMRLAKGIFLHVYEILIYREFTSKDLYPKVYIEKLRKIMNEIMNE
jgi:hypothetical protein